MPAEVRVPVLGESVVEATVGAWLKREGDTVEAGEALVQLETEKVNVDVSADTAGVLGQIQHTEGDTVHPGDILATLEPATAQPNTTPTPSQPQSTPAPSPDPTSTRPAADGSPAPGPDPTSTRPAPDGSPAPGPDPTSTRPAPDGSPAPSPDSSSTRPASDGSPASSPDLTSARPERGVPAGQAAAAAPEAGAVGDRPHASPVARRMADERGLDLGQVQGTGTGGRVTREDVERHLSGRPTDGATAPPPPAPAPVLQPSADARGETRVRMTRRRQTIAQRLLEAQRTAAMLTTFNEADMSAIMAIRTRRRDAFLKRHGVGLGFMSFFTRAVIGALKAFPNLNAEIRGDEIVQKHYYDIGIAVGAEGGLVVPILRDADRKSFAEIERGIAELAQKAQTNTLTLDDLRGGTFTITNGGVFGSLLSTPILSPPQVGILGMHKIQQRPIALDNQVVIRPMMYLALTYDHRIVDGREAVQFLVRVKELVEDPTELLLD